LTQSLTLAVALFVASGALTAAFWHDRNMDLQQRLVRLPLLPVAICAWGILFVAIARKLKWPAQVGVGLAVVISSACYFVALIVSTRPPAWGGFSILGWWFCRSVLYTESEWTRTAVKPPDGLTTLHLNS
ncbi:MAG: hypothetical protein ACRD4E_18670, partial [Bryobacteraceae bacterium]